jgi:DNA-binding Lrp family transcriptional regulator
MSLDGRNRARTRAERSAEDVSDLDKRIIEHLQTDGRRPFTQIANDLLIETVCEDNEALLRFLTQKLRAIEGVRETETFVYLRMVKQTYQWGTR